MSEYDVIIVGAGHNGLTAGVELQRAGKKVLILEKTNWPGGQAATKELFKGYKHSVGAWALLIFREEMIKYLEMDKEGFELIRPESSYTVFGDEGDAPFIGYTDPIELANHVVEDPRPRSARGLHGFGQPLRDLQGDVREVHARDPSHPGGDHRYGPPTRRRGERFSRSSATEAPWRSFASSSRSPASTARYSGSLSASAIDGTDMGPFTKGSGLSMAYHYTAGDTYDFKIPKGGIGTVSSSLQKVFERYGGEVRFKAVVDEFIVEDGAVVGVRMKGGEELRSKAVVSTLDAQMTFGALCPDGTLPSDFTNSVEDIEYKNGYVQVHMTIKRLPTFANHLEFVNGTVQSWLIAYIKSPEQLHRAWRQARSGQVADDPAVYTYFPSQLDPSLAPDDGTHTCTMFSHYFPTEFPGSSHNEAKNLMVERMIGQMEKVIPDFRDLIMDKVVFTPAVLRQDLQRDRWRLLLGSPASGPDVWRSPGSRLGRRVTRPHSETSTSLAPACHPGPGVTCIPGLNGARVVLAELNKRKSKRRLSSHSTHE